jgi:hypothetical protein
MARTPLQRIGYPVPVCSSGDRLSRRSVDSIPPFSCTGKTLTSAGACGIRDGKSIIIPFPLFCTEWAAAADSDHCGSILAFHKSCYRLIRKHGIVPNRFWHPLIISGLAIRILSVSIINIVGRFTTIFAFRKRTESKNPRRESFLNLSGCWSKEEAELFHQNIKELKSVHSGDWE